MLFSQPWFGLRTLPETGCWISGAAHFRAALMLLSGVRKQRIGFQKGLGPPWRLSGKGRKEGGMESVDVGKQFA
jgi:hypothetical protein